MFQLRTISALGCLLAAGSGWADISFLTPTASSGIASGQSVTSNTTRLQKDNLLYQARFSLIAPNDWTGELLEFAISSSGTVSSAVESASKQASTGLNGRPFSDRAVFSVDAPGDGGNGVVFDSSLFSSPVTVSSTVSVPAEVLVNYLKGDDIKEAKNDGNLRSRSSRLGDIINSAPQFAGNLNFGYHALSGGTADIGEAYVDFITSGTSNTRPGMIYVGANDGMLHGFDADSAGLEEVFAYVPLTITDRLASLASPSYQHQYYVDGTPRIADAYDGSRWKTVLVGTTGAGGSAVFALDVSDPLNFDAASVLWEHNSGTLTELGYTLGQPSVVILPDGDTDDSNNQWAAVFGSGYQEPANNGVLYMIDAFSGALIRKLSTGAASGLSTPLAVDSDGDLTADIVYAGDLSGKLWKFYFDADASPQWRVLELFNAGRPITAKPQAVKFRDLGVDKDGFMVLFGTGRYFADADKGSVTGSTADPSPFAFYGIWDKNTGSAAPTPLTSQTITAEGAVRLADGSETEVRVTSNSSSNATSGWKLVLSNYADPNKPGNVFQERVVSEALVRNGRVVFSTLVPNGIPFDGTGWLMELDAFSGARLGDVPFDVNKDGKFDDQDKVKVQSGKIDADGSGNLVAVSGTKSTVGLIATPNVVSAVNKEFKHLSGSSGDIQTVVESTKGATFSKGRQSWQQLK